MQKLLTIVVPVYKVEQYINKCLDSCIIYMADGSLDEEKMNQLEVIIVNDGTPDNSAELSREYTVRYPQTFRQIDKENGGHGSAWNVGLKEATGKYLRFLDSDDWLTNLDKLMEKLQDCDADLVMTALNTFYADTQKNKYTQNQIILNIKSSIDRMKDVPSFWVTTYKTSILKPYAPLFMEHVMYDDSILYIAPYLKAKTFVAYDYVLYNYLIGRVGQSVSNQVSQRSISHYILTYNYLKEFYFVHQNENKYFEREARNVIIGNSCQIISHMSHTWWGCRQIKDFLPMCYQDDLFFQSHKIIKRYKKWPLFVFYAIQKVKNSCIYTYLRKVI